MSDKEADAADSYEWLKAYMDAGFTRTEAMRILCRPWVTLQPTASQYPPDLYEFWERQNSLATKMLNEYDD